MATESDTQSKQLAYRIATSIRELGFFIGQQDLDDVQRVISVLNAAGVARQVLLKYLDKQRKYYTIDINERPCKVKCTYESGCSRDDDKCIQDCIETCLTTLRQKIVEVLLNYASRRD